MIYQIVEIETGRCMEKKLQQSLKALKKTLRYVNLGGVLTDRGITHAIACYLPSEAFVTVGKAMLPTPIKELSVEQRKIFWDYYTKTSSYEIPCSEFKKSEVQQ